MAMSVCLFVYRNYSEGNSRRRAGGMRPKTDETQMREEDGVRSYSVVRVYRGGVCDICLKDVTHTAEISRTERYVDDETRTDALDICEGCAYRVGALFDA